MSKKKKQKKILSYKKICKLLKLFIAVISILEKLLSHLT